MNRRIDTIIIHCSATKAGQDFTAADIDRWHRERGFDGIGYHYVVRLNGKIEKGRDVALPGAHCPGWNTRSIGICYVGGLDADGQPADTRTNAQKRVLYQLIQELQRTYPSIDLVLGHRDTSPDKNGNGIIEPFEYVKACPCFDVKEFLRTGRSMLFLLLAALMFSFLLSSCKSSKSLGYQRIERDSISASVRNMRTESSSQASHSISGNEEEHIEQTVLVFREDTTSRDLSKRHSPLASVIRTVVDRKSCTGIQSKEQSYIMAVDSVKKVGKLEVKKEETLSKKSRWWLWIIIGMLVLYRIIKKYGE
ncbi:N-acetylmuramoyl-L-alanine amidase [Bacteroides sp.]